MRRILRIAGPVLVVALVAGLGYSWHRGWLERSYWRATVGCGGQDWTPAPPAPAEDLDLALEAWDGTGDRFTAVAWHPERPLAYAVDQAGPVTVVDLDADGHGEIRPTPTFAVDASTDHDQGLLGVAVDPAGDWLYLHFTDAAGDSNVEAVALDADGEPVPDRRRTILFVDQPTVHHNGGGMVFLDDATMLLTLGDGGKIGDRDGHGQRADTLLGGILRIRPTPAGDEPYEIPDDNPFADGVDGAPETFALGLRNPFRIGIDAPTDRLFVADVGHNCYEEISVASLDPATVANFGWNRFEGTRVFLGGEPDGYVAPTIALPHADGICAVIGGGVARGGAAPSIEGHYLFADLCTGALFAFDADTDAPTLWRLDLQPPGALGIFVDPAGDLVVVSPGTIGRVADA